MSVSFLGCWCKSCISCQHFFQLLPSLKLLDRALLVSITEHLLDVFGVTEDGVKQVNSSQE